MPRFICPVLCSLSELLMEKYKVRNKVIAHESTNTNLMNAEYDLISVHKLIASHRRGCKRCSLTERRQRLTISRRPSSGESPIVPIGLAS